MLAPQSSAGYVSFVWSVPWLLDISVKAQGQHAHNKPQHCI